MYCSIKFKAVNRRKQKNSSHRFCAFSPGGARQEEYYWVDQTRVDKETYEASTFVLHHHYEIMELMDPKNLPFNPDDTEMVSMFGFGRFTAFADLSYGC